ncbi:MAG TPA: hypothetical protein VF831_11285, partial [Anaerolineales bacterium]
MKPFGLQRYLLPLIIVLGISISIVGCTTQTPQSTVADNTLTPTEVISTATPAVTQKIASVTPTPRDGPIPTGIPKEITPGKGPASVTLINPGFEERDADGKISGWNQTGSDDAIISEDRGQSGDFRLTHKAAGAYKVETWQTVSGLANDWYTLHAWVRSSGGQNEVNLALKCGGQEKRVSVPATTPG